MAARTSTPVKRSKKPPASSAKKRGTTASSKRTSTLADRKASVGKAILIHGPTGAGKTTLAIHKAPRPVLVLDADQGIDSIIGTTNPEEIILWEGSDWESLDEFRDYVKSGDWDFKTIVVDNVTVAQKPVIRYAIEQAMAKLDDAGKAKRDPDIPSQQDWGKIYRVLDKWIVDIKSVAKQKGVNVIFTAGTAEWLDADAGYTKLMPDIEGKERNQIATHMDAVGWLEHDEDGRRLHLAPSGAFITKVRLPIDQHGQVPDEIEDPDFTKMISAVQGKKPKASRRKK